MQQTKLILTALCICAQTYAEVHCDKAGPQAPRDILHRAGSSSAHFKLAPSYQKMNLCNIHTHTNAEHKGPDYLIKKGSGNYDGYQCNDTTSLTEAQRQEPANRTAAYGKVKTGDTIEVHWVFTSCKSQPGPGLSACVPEGCINPVLRVESQVFLVVNDAYALDFNDYTLSNEKKNGFSQPKAIPQDTGKPIVYRGSTTGMYYDESKCSPAEVTWSVRPLCAKLNVTSLDKWAASKNVFEETASHGVRQLVVNPKLLSKITDEDNCTHN